MRQWTVTKGTRDLKGLRLDTLPDPVPQAGEVLIRVHAVSLNASDFYIIRSDFFGGAIDHDHRPLSDGAGEVVAVGARVAKLKVGDRVAGLYYPLWQDGPFPENPGPILGQMSQGMFGTLVSLPESAVIQIPDSLSYQEAATLPCAGLTAWNGLFNGGRPLAANETALVLGTGGVSILAMQMAKALGARVAVTSRTDEKLERAKALGADISINTTQRPDWDAAVLEATGGVDKVIDTGGNSTFAKSINALARNGEVAMIGVKLDEAPPAFTPMGLQFKAASLRGLSVGSAAMFDDMLDFIDLKKLRPHIDRVFEFEDAVRAYEHLDSPNLFGKIVIKVN